MTSTTPPRTLLGVCCPTHAACNAWLHSAGESFLAFLSFRLSQQIENSPQSGWEKTPAALFRATPSRLELPPTSPRRLVNLEDSQSETALGFCAHFSAECPAMPATSDNRIPSVTAVPPPNRDGNTRVLPHLSAPALALEYTRVAPSNGHSRYCRHNTRSLYRNISK